MTMQAKNASRVRRNIILAILSGESLRENASLCEESFAKLTPVVGTSVEILLLRRLSY